MCPYGDSKAEAMIFGFIQHSARERNNVLNGDRILCALMAYQVGRIGIAFGAM